MHSLTNLKSLQCLVKSIYSTEESLFYWIWGSAKDWLHLRCECAVGCAVGEVLKDHSDFPSRVKQPLQTATSTSSLL